MLHNDRGQSVLDENLKNWKGPNGEFIFGPTVRYTWIVDGVGCEVKRPNNQSWYKLPDDSGFIYFENNKKPDNCLLLNDYGNELVRLTVPWQLTKSENPESAKSPTAFAGVGAPCINPADGNKGSFGVEA